MFAKSIILSIVLALSGLAAVAQAPGITLRGADGSTFSMADMRGKVVVFSFGATWVPMTSRELPALQKLAAAHPRVNFYWVATNPAKGGATNSISDSELLAFAQRNGLKFAVLRDLDKAAYRAFGLNSLPTTVVIDQDGNVKFRHEGFDPDQAEPFGEISQILNSLLK